MPYVWYFNMYEVFLPNLRDTKPYNVVLWTNIISSTFALDFYFIMIKY